MRRAAAAAGREAERYGLEAIEAYGALGDRVAAASATARLGKALIDNGEVCGPGVPRRGHPGGRGTRRRSSSRRDPGPLSARPHAHRRRRAGAGRRSRPRHRRAPQPRRHRGRGHGEQGRSDEHPRAPPRGDRHPARGARACPALGDRNLEMRVRNNLAFGPQRGRAGATPPGCCWRGWSSRARSAIRGCTTSSSELPRPGPRRRAMTGNRTRPLCARRSSRQRFARIASVCGHCSASSNPRAACTSMRSWLRLPVSSETAPIRTICSPCRWCEQRRRSCPTIRRRRSRTPWRPRASRPRTRMSATPSRCGPPSGPRSRARAHGRDRHRRRPLHRRIRPGHAIPRNAAVTALEGRTSEAVAGFGEARARLLEMEQFFTTAAFVVDACRATP